MTREIVANLAFKNSTNKLDAEALSRAIESGYLKQRRESKFTVKKTFAPSSIGYGHGTCARYWYHAFSGAWFSQEGTDALGVANMANGVDAHTRIQKVMREAGILKDEEVELRIEDPPIFGYIDVIISWEGEDVIGEIKTTRQEAFIFRQNTMKPTTNHLLQILVYMRAKGVDKGFVMYENKNTQEFLILPVNMNKRNTAILNNALDWLREVRANWEAGQLPTRSWTQKNKNCKGCPVFDECWDNLETKHGDGVVTIKPMDVPK